MKTLIWATGAMLVAATLALPAEQTWTGQIGDSRCGAKHEEDADAAGGGKQGVPPEHQCVVACVRGGSKYVLVVGDTTYQIADQKDAALETHAGETVSVTGELKGNTITVSKIDKP